LASKRPGYQSSIEKERDKASPAPERFGKGIWFCQLAKKLAVADYIDRVFGYTRVLSDKIQKLICPAFMKFSADNRKYPARPCFPVFNLPKMLFGKSEEWANLPIHHASFPQNFLGRRELLLSSSCVTRALRPLQKGEKLAAKGDAGW